MSTVFMRRGDTYRVTTDERLDIHAKLPAENFVIKFDIVEGFYLEKVAPFDVPSKIYGTHRGDAERILETFMTRSSSTGVLLAGEKGSGKTMAAKLVSMNSQRQGMPTIIVNQPYYGDAFNTLIHSITQPCVFMFDEFEKVYSEEKQQMILTLLDGIYTSKKLFLLTTNDQWKINQYMHNRPGRLYYMLEYDGVDDQFVREFCEDRLYNKGHIEAVVAFASMVWRFNFDMLQALVEEMNRYGESPSEALRLLNCKPSKFEAKLYEIAVKADGEVIEKEFLQERHWQGQPLLQQVFVEWWTGQKDEHGRYEAEDSAMFHPSDITSIRGTVFQYRNEDGDTLTLKCIEERKGYDYRGALSRMERQSDSVLV